MPAIGQTSTRAKSAAKWPCKRLLAARRITVSAGDWVGRMQSDITPQSAAIFAANRARGAVRFDVSGVDGVTRRRELHEAGSLRVRFPSPEDRGLSAVLVNTAGGIAGGDRFEIDIACRDDSRLTVTTAAAEKIYRAGGPAAELNVTLKADGRSHLAW